MAGGNPPTPRAGPYAEPIKPWSNVKSQRGAWGHGPGLVSFENKQAWQGLEIGSSFHFELKDQNKRPLLSQIPTLFLSGWLSASWLTFLRQVRSSQRIQIGKNIERIDF